MSQLTHFLNGRFISEEELYISPRDLGFSRGYTVHEFIVTYMNHPFKLPEHINRLFSSAKIIGLQIPWTKEQIITWVNETLEKNTKDIEKTIRIFLTGGISQTLRQTGVPTIIIIISPRTPYPAHVYENGIKIKAVHYTRPYPQAKTNMYIEGVRQLSQIPEDITEVLYYNESQVFEGSGSNIFALIKNVLVTPKSHIIEGITRNTLLEVLKLNIPIEIRDFTFEELRDALEVFLTGSNSEIRGVIQINNHIIGKGKVGTITQEIMKQYKAYILKNLKA